jgi:hypothetical protein
MHDGRVLCGRRCTAHGLRRRNVGSRRQPGEPLRSLDALRSRHLRIDEGHRNREPCLQRLRSRYVQRDLQRHGLHQMDGLSCRTSGEDAGRPGQRSNLRGMRCGYVQHGDGRDLVHSVRGLRAWFVREQRGLVHARARMRDVRRGHVYRWQERHVLRNVVGLSAGNLRFAGRDDQLGPGVHAMSGGQLFVHDERRSVRAPGLVRGGNEASFGGHGGLVAGMCALRRR